MPCRAQRGNVLRRGAAAAAEDRRARIRQRQHGCGEGVGRERVDRLALFADRGKAGVRLCDDGQAARAFHHPHDASQHVRAGGAVDADRIGAERLERGRGLVGGAVKIRLAVRLKRERAEHGTVADAADGLHSGKTFLHAHQRLHQKQIHAAVQKRLGLLAVDGEQRVVAVRAVLAHGAAERRHIARNEHIRPDGAARERHERDVHLMQPRAQAMALQSAAVCAEGRRADDLAACGGIAPLQRLQDLRMRQHPLLRAAAARHPGL